MLNPVSAALRKKGISQRKFAEKLWETHAHLFTSLDRKTRSLEARLSSLGKGRQLEWWSKNTAALQVVAKELGVDLGSLGVGRESENSLFRFATFPALPPLNLKREERYHIGIPLLISDTESDQKPWVNLEHWFFGDGVNRTPQKLDWLQIEDEMEFSLVASHLTAASRHSVISVASVKDLFDFHIDKVRHRSPLIVAIDVETDTGQLHLLRDRAQTAPLLAISRHALPTHESGASQGSENRDASDVNMWRWEFHSSWREKVIVWVEQRLAKYGVKSNTNARELITWLEAFDPEQRWVSHSADVLQLCQLAQAESFSTFEHIDREQNIHALFERVFHINSKHLRLIESVVHKRWNDWHRTWDGELDESGWRAARITNNEFGTLLRAGHVTLGENGYRLTNPLLSRLVLRQVLSKQIRVSRPNSWWPACYDKSRRPLLDATLGSMSMKGLVEAVGRLNKDRVNKMSEVMGAAEALFVAIGKHLIWESKVPDGIKTVGEIVLSRLATAPENNPPWSRPYNTVEQKFEWISSVWVWSLFIKAPKYAVNSWFLPGWNPQLLPNKFPEWLHPRSSFFREHMPIPRRESLEYFSDVAYQWSKKLQVAPEGDVPPLLVPALIWRAACGAWPVDLSWWGKLFNDDWCERMLFRLFKTEGAKYESRAARLLWPSFIAWLTETKKDRERTSAVMMRENWQFPSCRADAKRFSPVVHWIAENLNEDDLLGSLRRSGIKLLQEFPQWLLTKHKLLVLRSLITSSPQKLEGFLIRNYFSKFLPDAVEGLVDFLHDQQLGIEAAVGIWSCAPSLADEILQGSGRIDVHARSKLALTCPIEQLEAVLIAFQKEPSILPEASRKEWVRYHLPNAGIHAPQLFEILKT